MDPILGAIGLRSISSCLKQNGHATDIIFMQADIAFADDNVDLVSYSDKILQKITDLVQDSDLIGLSCMALESQKAKQIINYVKKLSIPIIWGGIHATSNPDECIQYADIVCIGEGEEAVCELAQAMTNGTDPSGIRNLWFRNNGHVVKNSLRPLIQDLDALPFPDYDYDTHYVVKNDKINSAEEYYKDIQMVLVHTTRGCPHNCSYCCNSLLDKLYSSKNRVVRRTSVETVMKQLDKCKELLPALGMVWFTDDTFFIRPLRELTAFASEYKKRISMPFRCYTTPGTLTGEKLELLLDAGLFRIDMGVQTGSENTNKNVYHRNISNARVMKAAQLMSKYVKHPLVPCYQIIFQNPYETDNDLIETINFLVELPTPFLLEVFHLTFFPGSELHKRAKSDGLLGNDSLISYLDYKRSFELNENEKYLNFLIYLMEGYVNSDRLGKIPRFLLPVLVNKRIKNYFTNHRHVLNYLTNRYFDLSPFPEQKIQRYKMYGKVALGAISRSLWKSKKNNRAVAES
jgi:radical SAM superfamily enzyme YgiQ (UPF0313 family)